MSRSEVDAVAIERFLQEIDWQTLTKMYGCAHNSIIGFIASEWIKQNSINSIIDGAPSPKIGAGRLGQKNADLLLCRGDQLFAVVEVESGVSNYRDKLETLLSYLEKKHFAGLQFGLLVMINVYDVAREKLYKHNWNSVKKIVERVKEGISLVSLEKRKMSSDESVVGSLRKRNI